MSFISGAPLKKARNLLLGGDGHLTRLLLNLNNSGFDPASNQTFSIEAGGSAGFYDPAGKFNQCYNANGSAVWAGNRGLVSPSSSALWDVSSSQIDYTLSFWVKCTVAPPSGASTAIVTINEVPFDSNNSVSVSLISSGANLRVLAGVDISNNIIGTFLRDIPFDTNWHFVTMARIGNMHYVTFDGLPPAAGSTRSAVYRRSPGVRAIVIGRSAVTRQANALIDAVWLVDGTPYDVVNGFAVPTAAPVFV